MDKDYGKKMGELHLRYKKCKEPFLTDSECIDVRDWLKELYEYNSTMGHDINTIYFGGEYEAFCRICETRHLN